MTHPSFLLLEWAKVSMILMHWDVIQLTLAVPSSIHCMWSLFQLLFNKPWLSYFTIYLLNIFSFCDSHYFSIVYCVCLIILFHSYEYVVIQSKIATTKKVMKLPNQGYYLTHLIELMFLCIHRHWWDTYGFHISLYCALTYNWPLSFGHDMLCFHPFRVCFYELWLDWFHSLVEKKVCRLFTLFLKIPLSPCLPEALFLQLFLFLGWVSS